MDATPLRPALALAMLVGAAVQDVQTRRVPNRYWIPFAAFSAVFLAIDLAGDRVAWVSYVVAAFACGVLYLFWRLHLFGGADAKGLMVLAFLVPVQAGSPLPPVLAVLVVGSLLNLLPAVALLVWNVLHGRFRFPAAFLGVPMPLERARRSHVWPMQDVQPDGRVTWRYWQRLGVDNEDTYARLLRAGVDPVWTTAKLPMMVALAVAFAITWAWGPAVLRMVAGAR
ncbi:MAG: A24 family peptidase [Thermoplasmatota archaeon]